MALGQAPGAGSSESPSSPMDGYLPVLSSVWLLGSWENSEACRARWSALSLRFMLSGTSPVRSNHTFSSLSFCSAATMLMFKALLSSRPSRLGISSEQTNHQQTMCTSRAIYNVYLSTAFYTRSMNVSL